MFKESPEVINVVKYELSPYLLRISHYHGEVSCKEFISFFLTELDAAIAATAESIDSEIEIVAELFSACVERTLSGDLMDVEGRVFLTKSLYPEIKKLGMLRGWDMQMLHVSIIDSINQVQNKYFAFLSNKSGLPSNEGKNRMYA